MRVRVLLLNLLDWVAALFLLCCFLLWMAFPLHAQRTNTFFVDQFAGPDVATKTRNAQAACVSDITCVLVFDPSLARLPNGNMPSKGVSEMWVDYRTPDARNLSSAVVKALNGIRFADQFASLAAAAADCGGAACTIVIPSSYTTGVCPPLNPKVTWWDLRGDGSASCTQNVFAYSHNDGNVNAMVLEQQQVQGYASGGSALTHWFQTYCNNCDVSGSPGGGLDGISSEVVFTGTLIGTVQGATGNEAPCYVTSTGGTVTNCIGLQGYVGDVAGRTTAIVNGIGVDGLGCVNLTGSPKPINCFALYGHDQNTNGGQASSRNYALGIEGKGLLGYSGNSGAAGFDIEDHNQQIHPFLYSDSSDNVFLRAMPGANLYLLNGAGAVVALVENATNLVKAQSGVVASNGTSPSTCSAANRGALWSEFGGSGAKDVLWLCAKDAANAYAWAQIY